MGRGGGASGSGAQESIWFRGQQQRPRKPRLSRERIVQAAVGLLDTEGLDGFSMRRLAGRLNAGTMSLYEYVATREDVLDLALDEVMAEIQPAGPDGASWRAALTSQLTQSREVMRRHPWVPALIGTRPLLGPNALARAERFYAVLSQAGLEGRGLVAAVGALSFYANGFVTAENVWRSWVGSAAEEAELRRRSQQHLVTHADRYPTLSAHAQLEDDDFDGGFTLGVWIILDGIQAQLTR